MLGSLFGGQVTVRMEELISEYLRKRSHGSVGLDLVERKLRENGQKMQNLLVLVEKGIDLDTVLYRIKQLEREKVVLEAGRARAAGVAASQIDVKDASKSIAQFLLDFENKFDQAPIQERKELIRQVVLGVTVNPVKRIARCAITKIPMVNQTLTALIKPPEFVGAHCSGGRT